MNRCRLFPLAVVLLALTGASTTHGTIAYSTGGASGGSAGTISSQPGSTPITFDEINLMTVGTTYTTPGPGTTATFTNLSAGPNGSFVIGNSAGQYSAPSGDTTQYLAVGQPTSNPVTVTMSSPVSYFGLFWSTPDNYNTIQFLDAGGLTLMSYTPGVTPGFIASGASTPYVNFFVTSGNPISQIVFSSPTRAFEIDNLAFTVVPEPSSEIVLALGVVGAGVFGYGRRFMRAN